MLAGVTPYYSDTILKHHTGIEVYKTQSGRAPAIIRYDIKVDGGGFCLVASVNRYENPHYESDIQEMILSLKTFALAKAKPQVSGQRRHKAKRTERLALVPALSFATAVHKLLPLESTDRNFNMETQGRTQNQWPTEGHTNDSRDMGRWLHSDFKNVPLPYVFQMYQEMINRGSLQ